MSSNDDRYNGSPSRDDAALSSLYRQTATETTPARLDQRVLKEARSSVRPRFALPAEWMRPLAWTATLGLCLAVALNLTIEPEDAIDWTGDIAEPVEPLAEQEAAPGSETAKVQAAASPAVETRAQEHDRASAPPARPSAADVASVNRPTSSDKAVASAELDAPSGGSTINNAGREDDGQAAALLREDPTGTGSRAAYPARDEPAAETARAKSFAFMDRTAALSEQIAGICEGDDIATPEAWLACIDALEDEGRNEEADAERRRFTMMHPDYVLE